MKLNTPLTDSVVEQLHAGDKVSITGTIYVGRDAAGQWLDARDSARRGDPEFLKQPGASVMQVAHLTSPPDDRDRHVTAMFT